MSLNNDSLLKFYIKLANYETWAQTDMGTQLVSVKKTCVGAGGIQDPLNVERTDSGDLAMDFVGTFGGYD